VTTASRATGKSLVPAVMTTTRPCELRRLLGSQKVRGDAIWAPCENAGQDAACSSLTAVSRHPGRHRANAGRRLRPTRWLCPGKK